ncbi:MAG: hypothetical protein K2G82_01990, partial [Paramuribaculum sp.]|nr:hypothetical protein [Paramuribaculum sp.]
MKRYKPIIALIAMVLLMLWPPVAAQAQTLKTATFEVKNKTVDTGKKIAIPFDDTKLTIEFDYNSTGDGSYFGVSKETKASFSLGDGKRIKSVTLKGAPLVNKGISTVKSYFVFHESLTSTTTSKEYLYDSATPTSGNFVETLSIKTATSLPYGSAKPLVIKFNSSLSSKSSLLKVGTIIVSYYDESELPKDNTLIYGLDYATPILYKNIGSGESESSDWTTAIGFAPITLDGATVMVKLGETITTFTRPSTAKDGDLTVIIDPAKRLIGAAAGVSFFTSVSNADDKLYKIEYLFNASTSDANGYQRVSSNSTLPAASAINYATSGTTAIRYKAPNIAFGLQDLTNLSLTESNAKCTVKTTGIKDLFTNTTVTNDAAKTIMCVAFDGIRVSYLSASEAPVLPPMAPVVTMPSAAVMGADGVYKLLGSLELTPAINPSEVYEGASVVYSIDGSDFEPLPEGGKIMIDKSCVLQLKSVVSGSDESGVLSYKFDKLDIVNVDKASELEGLKAGTLVRLNCPLQMLADGSFKTNADDHYIFTHDTEYRSVPLVVRGEKTKPSNAFQPSTKTAIDAQNFIPEGGVVGTLEFENGRPVIVLKDKEGIDNYSLCYAGSAVLHYNSANVGKNYVRFTYTHNRRTEILPEDFGSIINIDATYSLSTGKFTVKKAGADGQGNEPIELDVRQLSNNFVITTLNSYSTATNPTADGDYTLCGLVGYDYDSKSYFLLPRFIGKKLPELTIEPVAGSYATPTKFVKPDGTTPGKLYLEMTGKQFGLKLGGKNNNNQYYCVEVDKTSGAGFYKQATSKEATIDVTNVTIPADEPLKLLVYLNGQGASSAINPETTMLYSARMYHMEVYNAVEGADEYTSIAKLLQDAKEHPEEMNAYVRLTCPNMAIAVVRDNRSSNESDWNCMVVKDITSLINGEENADIPSLPLIFKNGIGMFSSSYFQYSNTTDKYYKNPRPGEYVQEMTFRVRIDENGNLTGDLTDFDQRYKSYAASAETHFGYNPELRPGEPWFKKHAGSITLPEHPP